MSLRHTLALAAAALLTATGLAGCYLDHGLEEGPTRRPIPAPTPGTTTPAVPTPGTPTPGTPTPATPPPPVEPALTCEDFLNGAPLGGVCELATFTPCRRQISGVDCCTQEIICEDGRVTRYITCDDSCGQACGFVEDEGDCQAYGCEWFASDACIEPGEPFYEPSCINPRTTPCGGPGDLCPGGEVCTGFPRDPCAGSLCDACLGFDYHCAYPTTP